MEEGPSALEEVPLGIKRGLLDIEPIANKGEPSAIEGPQYNTLTLGSMPELNLKTPVLKFDHAYGIKAVQDSTKFKIDDSEVQIESNYSIVDDNRFVVTQGIWKLFTLKKTQMLLSI